MEGGVAWSAHATPTAYVNGHQLLSLGCSASDWQRRTPACAGGSGKAAAFGSFFNIQQVLLQYLGFCSGHLEGSISPVIKAPPLSQASPVRQQMLPWSVVVQDGAAASAVLQRAAVFKKNLRIKAATVLWFPSVVQHIHWRGSPLRGGGGCVASLHLLHGE